MRHVFQHHFDILPEAQKKIWPGLKEVKNLGFILYGGTALALRLGHRQSIDFDFFTEKDLDIKKIAGTLPFIKDSEILQSGLNTYTLQTRAGVDFVKISFFGKIDFGRVGDPDLTADENLLVASLADILATKLKVLMQRVEEKDYRDIAALLVNGSSLEYGLAGAAALFGKTFSPVDCLRALEYFDDPELSALREEDKRVLKNAVKHTLSAGRLPGVPVKSKILAPGSFSSFSL